MSNELYDTLKKSVQIVIPGMGVIYLILNMFWHLPGATEEVLKITTSMTLILGIIVDESSRRYNKSDKPFSGDLVVSEGQNGSTLYSMELNEDPEIIESRDSVTFKVIRN